MGNYAISWSCVELHALTRKAVCKNNVQAQNLGVHLFSPAHKQDECVVNYSHQIYTLHSIHTKSKSKLIYIEV